MISFNNFLTLGNSDGQRNVGTPRWWNTTHQPVKPMLNGMFSAGPIIGYKTTSGNSQQPMKPKETRMTYRNSSF